MNITKYVIYTHYGNTYEVSAEGYVIKYSNGLDKTNANIEGLKTWQIKGLLPIKPFNQVGELIPLADTNKINNFTFKNGKAKYTLMDIDHGTTRITGNWNVHGVKSVEIINS